MIYLKYDYKNFQLIYIYINLNLIPVYNHRLNNPLGYIGLKVTLNQLYEYPKANVNSVLGHFSLQRNYSKSIV